MCLLFCSWEESKYSGFGYRCHLEQQVEGDRCVGYAFFNAILAEARGKKKNPSSLGAEEVGNNRFLKGMSFRVFQ